MRRKHNLPPSPLAPRQPVKFELADPEQARAGAAYLRNRLDRLARDRANSIAWSRQLKHGPARCAPKQG
jgi:hypothetical protein